MTKTTTATLLGKLNPLIMTRGSTNDSPATAPLRLHSTFVTSVIIIVRNLLLSAASLWRLIAGLRGIKVRVIHRLSKWLCEWGWVGLGARRAYLGGGWLSYWKSCRLFIVNFRAVIWACLFDFNCSFRWLLNRKPFEITCFNCSNVRRLSVKTSDYVVFASSNQSANLLHENPHAIHQSWLQTISKILPSQFSAHYHRMWHSATVSDQILTQ